MGEETITVGEVSAGDRAGDGVELPVVDVLTGRAFVTGKSGSGKSNSASVICEKLLDSGYGILIVDIDGEYYGLKEEYEILHVGADDECDLRVGVEHAEKIAELALEQNVPIILDVSSFLDESEARELLTEVTKHLFAKEKKLKQPFLMLVEEVHEYIPEGGGVDECGRMLIKVSKRGRKHGLGVVGISQRPADVKKDFITQCDWLVWHRLTWNNDTKVVGRILGSDYADEIEDMGDGECFLMTDWDEDIRRVQFERKRTFDAGATPGLDDFERPELKSVSGSLVEELEEITDEQNRRANRIEELERELKQKEDRIQDLERQLADARDLKQMADRFSRAMMEQVTGRPLSAAPGRQSQLGEAAVRRDPQLEADLDAVRNGDREPTESPVPDAAAEWDGSDPNVSEDSEANADADTDPQDGQTGDSSGGTIIGAAEAAGAWDEAADASQGSDNGADSEAEPHQNGTEPLNDDAEPLNDDTEPLNNDPEPNSDGGSKTQSSDMRASVPPSDDPLVARLRREIDDLDDRTREMLRRYRDAGPLEPTEAHRTAGGSGDRGPAYAANRTLRQRGLVAHVGCGYYDYALTALVESESSDRLSTTGPSATAVAKQVQNVEAAFVDGVSVADDSGDAAETVDKPDASATAWPTQQR
ncbi:DUF87 domain protein [Natronomonas pharaonis DSM 2160]|uniref:DUF87 domain protein n=1 Tax=Natronomonas pharaonis (strain ATCC 35678 / DSM 2160 / CIP 103997 / JCM 8858 / NBRC 14720 / NCIMB 2260 / Gabara) TaxID=348780 RepID=A0A1U7EVU8_NATPD|nr:DUF87 domain-containing protein [Natronomonas pharaonis]CAI49181.1 DUF87 domain protein [Natronomonas pharaonis DSM 2160]